MTSLRHLSDKEVEFLVSEVKTNKLSFKNILKANGKVYKLTKKDLTDLRKKLSKEIFDYENIPRYLSEKEIDYLVGDLPAPPSCVNDIMEFNREKIINNLKFDLSTFRICPTKSALKKIKNKISETYFRTLCKPGEPVGSHGAMSLGQGLTQANLDVFHIAGSANSKEEEQKKLDQLFSPNTKKSINSTTVHLLDKNLTREEIEIYYKKKFKGINIEELIINSEILDKVPEKDNEWYNNYMAIFNKDFETKNNFMRLVFNTSRCYTYGISTTDIANIIEKTTRVQNSKKSINCVVGPTSSGIIDVHVELEFMRSSLQEFSTKGTVFKTCKRSNPKTYVSEDGTREKTYIKSVLDLNTNLEEIIIIFLNEIIKKCFSEMNITGIKGIENILVQENKLNSFLKFKKVVSDKDLNKYSSKSYNIKPNDFYRLYYVYISYKSIHIMGIPVEKFLKYLELCGMELVENNTSMDDRPYFVFLLPKVPDQKIKESDVDKINDTPENQEKLKKLVGKNRFVEKGDTVYDLIEDKEIVTVEEPTELLSRKYNESLEEFKSSILNENEESVSSLDFPDIYRYSTYSFIKVYGKNILSEVLKEKSVDNKYTFSNNVKEISNYYGIEAARLFFVKEYTSNKEIQKMNPVNIELLVDYQTSSGQIHSVTSTDIAKHSKNSLVAASFEQPLEAFKKASSMGTTDKINNVPSCVMTGKRNNVGTGIVQMFYDDSYLKNKKNKLSFEERKDASENISIKEDEGSCFGPGKYSKLTEKDFSGEQEKTLAATEEPDQDIDEFGDLPDIEISNIDYEDQTMGDI